jgi:hypothetical protein
MYHDGIYYLAVETYESEWTPSSLTGKWKTRVLTATSPIGPFTEIPAGPLYGVGAACVFQHQEGSVLHSYFCQQSPTGAWTLDHVTGDLSSPN